MPINPIEKTIQVNFKIKLMLTHNILSIGIWTQQKFCALPVEPYTIWNNIIMKM